MTEDGGFAEARAEYLALAANNPRDPALSGAALRVVKAAFTARDPAAADEYAQKATGPLAARYRGAALLFLGRFEEGFEILDQALVDRGPAFGGGGTFVSPPKADPRTESLDELQAVAAWAALETPEWVRALGVARDRHPEEVASHFQRRFLQGLERVVRGQYGLEDLDVVVRQLRQRGAMAAAETAVQVGIDHFPEDSLLWSQLGNLRRHLGRPQEALVAQRRCAELLEGEGSSDASSAWLSAMDAALAAKDSAAWLECERRAEARIPPGRRDLLNELEFYRLRAAAAEDPASALPRAVALFDGLGLEPLVLVESKLGLAIADLAIDLCLKSRDLRAVRIQETLVEGKRAAWGDCPALWLEQQNLGTIWAQLGEPQKARALIEAARKELIAALGPGAAEVELCDRSLAKLGPL
ncbi:MAG: hypothetical protein U1E65_21650 [Myxococcota bacterium]